MAQAIEPKRFAHRAWRILSLVALAAAVALVVGRFYDVALTIFAGILLGVFLHGLALAVHPRIHVTYRRAVAFIVILLITLIVAVSWLIGPQIVDQLGILISQLPADVAAVVAEVRKVPMLQPFVASAPRIEPVVGEAATLARATFETVAGIVIVIVIGIYSAFDPGIYRRATIRLVPPHRRPRAEQILTRTTKMLMRWIIGRVIVMIVVGVITTVGFWISGVPLPFALGVLAGVMTFIPYLGVLLSIIPALLVALTKSPIEMVWVVLVFVIAHGIEGYVLSPLIAKRTVSFPPAFTIGVQLIAGAAWGILGFTFATPLAVIGVILIETLYVEDALGDHSTPVEATPVERTR